MYLWTQNNVKNHNDLRPKNVYLQSQPQPHGQVRGQLFLRWSLLAEKKDKVFVKIWNYLVYTESVYFEYVKIFTKRY